MPLPENVLNTLKCCLNKNGHIVIDPVVLKCKGSACKQCVKDIKNDDIECYCCNEKHLKRHLLEAPGSIIAETLVQTFLTDLFEYIENKLQLLREEFKSETLIDELNSKIQGIENEMDIRVESLVASIHDYRDECKVKLDQYKENFERKVKNFADSEKKKEVNNSSTVDHLKEKQNELKRLEIELKYFKENEVEFLPSKFEFFREQFGDIKEKNRVCWLNDSLILNVEESLFLADTTRSKKGTLLYRATRDGFTCKAFHSLCDGKEKTITIIKNNLNYVFGGYASAAWNSSDSWIVDDYAFVFSLRRDDITKCEKLKIKTFYNALIGSPDFGPVFGHSSIRIKENSNEIVGSCSNLSSTYHPPEGMDPSKATEYLAGNFNQWLSTEIEVYQIN